jgi:hypothetical protein
MDDRWMRATFTVKIQFSLSLIKSQGRGFGFEAKARWEGPWEMSFPAFKPGSYIKSPRWFRGRLETDSNTAFDDTMVFGFGGMTGAAFCRGCFTGWWVCIGRGA